MQTAPPRRPGWPNVEKAPWMALFFSTDTRPSRKPSGFACPTGPGPVEPPRVLQPPSGVTGPGFRHFAPLTASTPTPSVGSRFAPPNRCAGNARPPRLPPLQAGRWGRLSSCSPQSVQVVPVPPSFPTLEFTIQSISPTLEHFSSLY